MSVEIIVHIFYIVSCLSLLYKYTFIKYFNIIEVTVYRLVLKCMIR